MLNIRITSRFKKDLRAAEAQQKSLPKLRAIIDLLQAQEPLPGRHRDHALTGNYAGHRECHLTPDWLLIYKIEPPDLILIRTGSHSELFG